MVLYFRLLDILTFFSLSTRSQKRGGTSPISLPSRVRFLTDIYVDLQV